MISVFSDAWKVLSPNLWSTLENIPCALENNLYSIFKWTFLYTLVRSSWSIVFFKSSLSVLIFCLVILHIIKNEYFK